MLENELQILSNERHLTNAQLQLFRSVMKDDVVV
jgi:hypothetical protein